MELTFIGATEGVTGSKFLVEHDRKRILLDCGLFQGQKDLRLRNWAPLPFAPDSLDAVVLTHAHIDHTGYLPLLVRNGFTGPIYCTPATKDLCSILLPDSGYIHEEDAKRANLRGYSKHKPALPLYTKEDATKCLEQFETVDLATEKHLGEEWTFSYSRAGHILGAAIVTMRTQHGTVVFSGDLGRLDDPIMHRPATVQYADLLVLESTYGNREHLDHDPADKLAEIINVTSKRGGSVIIPSFAVGRAQSLLYYIGRLLKEKRIPQLPIYLDSPMAINATKLFCRYHKEHRLSESETKEACGVARYTQTVEQSKAISESSVPSIIISASGMAVGGRILHHLKRFLPHSQHTVLLAGYQAEGTRGDRLLRGEKAIKIHGHMVTVRAQIESLENMSAHADGSELLKWLEGFQTPPRKTFLVHGNSEAKFALKSRIEERFNWNVEVPGYLQKASL